MGGSHLDVGTGLVPEVVRLLLGVGDDVGGLLSGVLHNARCVFARTGEQLLAFFFAFGEALLVKPLRKFL